MICFFSLLHKKAARAEDPENEQELEQVIEVCDTAFGGVPLENENNNVPPTEQEHDQVVEVCDTAFGGVPLENGNINVPPTETRNEYAGSDPKCGECVRKDLQIIDWERKYHQEVEQRKELKKVYVNTTIRFSELYSKYNDLLKTVESSRDHTANDAVATAQDDIFTENEVKFLQCMALEKKIDCTFIHHCLKYAYKVDLSVLVLRTLKGTSEWTETTKEGEQINHEAKLPLTPKKVERIKGLFIQRVSASRIDAAEYADRMKGAYVNKLLAAGIKNLSKKFK